MTPDAQDETHAGQPSPGSSWTSPGGVLDRLQARPPAETRYDIGEEIARGGMGAILRVRDGDLRRDLAMKVALGRGTTGSSSRPGSSLDDRTLGRFLEEAQITAQLDHPGIVPVHELGVDSQGRVFFTMALVRGVHLGVVLEHLHGAEPAEGKVLPEGDWTQTRVIGVLLKVCEAMSYAHAKGVLHRDLKPANIMVGSFGQVYVMDWGLARVIDAGPEPRRSPSLDRPAPVESDRRDAAAGDVSSPLLTMDGDVVGTPAYMSPEQARADWSAVGPPTDVYAIGAILYHVLAGHMPYGRPGGVERPGAEVWRAVRQGPPPPLLKLAPALSPELVAICEKAMAREPAERYPDTHALAEDLRAYLEGRVVGAWRTGPVIELRKWIARNRALAATGAAALLLALAGLLGAGWIQLRANAVLEERNLELQDARAESERRAGLLRLDGAALREARAANERALAAARREAYVGAITAAALSLEDGNLDEVRRQLEACPPELRGWEWHHHGLAADGSLATLEQLPVDLEQLEHARTGERLLLRDGTGRVALQPLAGGAPLWLDTGARAVHHAALGSSGRTVLVEQVGGRLALHDADRGMLLRELQAEGPRGVDLLPWHDADGGTAGFVTLDAEGHLRAWDEDGGLLAEQRLPYSVYLGNQASFLSMATAWSTGRLAVLEVGGVVELFELPSLRTLAEQPTEELALRIALHPGGRRVALLTGDGRLGEVQVGSGGTIDWIEGLDPRSGGSPLRIAYVPRGDRLVAGFRDRTIRVLATPGLEPLGAPARTGSSPRFSIDPRGERMLTYDGETPRLWHLWARRDATLLELPSPARQIALSPDGERIASLTLGAHAIGLRDARGGDPLGRLALHRGSLHSMAFDPAWSVCAAATTRGELSLWDPRSGERLRELGGHDGRVMAMAFSPDGRLLASAGRDGEVRLWHVATGRLLSVPVQQEATVTALAFHPDGRTLLWGDGQGVVARLDLAGGGEAILQPGGEPVRELALSPDGRWIALPSEGAEARLLDLETLTVRAVLRGHTQAVTSLAVFPGGDRLVTGSDDGDLRVWDTSSGRCLATLAGHQGTIAGLAVRPDGWRLVSAGLDQTLRLWDGRLDDARQAWDGAARRHAAGEELMAGWLELGDLDRALSRFQLEPDLAPLTETARRLVRDWRESEGELLAELLWNRAWPRRDPSDDLPDPSSIAAVTRAVLTFPELSVPARAYLRDTLALCSLRAGDPTAALEALDHPRTRRDPGRKQSTLPPADQMETLRLLVRTLATADQDSPQSARELLTTIARPGPDTHVALRTLYREAQERVGL